MTLLPLIDLVDNFRIETAEETITPLFLTKPAITGGEKQYPVGLLKPCIVDLLRADTNNAWIFDDKPKPYVVFPTSLDTPSKRSSSLDTLIKLWIAQGLFAEQTGGRMWRDELYIVYKDPFGPFTEANRAFAIERSAAALFGVVTYGVHMCMGVNFGSGNEECRLWIPTRAATKQTYVLWLNIMTLC